MNLSDDQMCFGCGIRNSRGLKLSLEPGADQRSIRTVWIPTKQLQGYADIVHGGIIGLVLDELMGNLLWKRGTPAVTAELTVRFHHPARVGEPLHCEAHLKSSRGRLFHLEARAKTAHGTRIASASGKLVYVRSSGKVSGKGRARGGPS